MWSFTVPERQPVGPDIQYGQAPTRATTGMPQRLRAGTAYRVRVMQTVGRDAAIAQGERVFTP